jgi:NADPH:quinone reductase-like Zn-dependent oxidoreductase
VRPVIDTRYDLADFRAGLDRLAQRDVFGKILVTL